MTRPWYTAKVTSPRVIWAWLLLLILAFTAPAQAMNGLKLSVPELPQVRKGAYRAKSLSASYGINAVDPDGLLVGVDDAAEILAVARGIAIAYAERQAIRQAIINTVAAVGVLVGGPQPQPSYPRGMISIPPEMSSSKVNPDNYNESLGGFKENSSKSSDITRPKTSSGGGIKKPPRGFIRNEDVFLTSRSIGKKEASELLHGAKDHEVNLDLWFNLKTGQVLDINGVEIIKIK